MHRGPVAEINLDAISHNIRLIREISSGKAIIAVVKADAYGHGAVKVSKSLVNDGVDYLAVAFTEEAKELRDSGINAPIIVLFDPDIKDILDYNLIPVISDKRTAIALSIEAEKNNKIINVHIKVDTGMGRLGLIGNVVEDILEISCLKGLKIQGIMSHFSDADLSDNSFAKKQIERFNQIRSELFENGLNIRLYHIANSAAVLSLKESHFDSVRPGLMLYGCSPMISNKLQATSYKLKNEKDPSLITEPAMNLSEGYSSLLIPAMTIKTKLLALRRLPAGTPISYGRTYITRRNSLIGVMPIGYADGFMRRLSNVSEVIVSGKRVPVVGRICMDISMVDLTDLEGVKDGDDVVIIGSQGKESISACEIAQKAETIPYEILTSLGNRAKRVYC